jgi:uncharacterized protein YkwD
MIRTVKKSSARSAGLLAVLSLCVSLEAYGASTFDPSINRLLMPSLSVNGVVYQDVAVTLHSFTVLSVDNGVPGADTFDPGNNLLSLGTLKFQGITYYNVRVLLNSVTVLAATPAPQTPGTAAGTLSAANTCNLPQFQTDVMALVNQARASSRMCGNTAYRAAAPLAWNNKLFNASAGHSADMANNNYFSHTSLDGRTFGQRITNAGYKWSRLGENIAAGQGSVQSVMAVWMASAGHCSNIMNGNLTEVGVACVINDSSPYRTYWTMDLGKP